MPESEWAVCPQCSLKHRPRPDGLCPRCRASLAPAARATSAPPVRAPSPAVSTAEASSSSPPALSVTGATVSSDDAILYPLVAASMTGFLVVFPAILVSSMGMGSGRPIGFWNSLWLVALLTIFLSMPMAAVADFILLPRLKPPLSDAVIPPLSQLETVTECTVRQLSGILKHDWPKPWGLALVAPLLDRFAPSAGLFLDSMAESRTVRVIPKKAIASLQLVPKKGLRLELTPTRARAGPFALVVGVASDDFARVRRHLERAGYPLRPDAN